MNFGEKTVIIDRFTNTGEMEGTIGKKIILMSLGIKLRISSLCAPRERSWDRQSDTLLSVMQFSLHSFSNPLFLLGSTFKSEHFSSWLALPSSVNTFSIIAFSDGICSFFNFYLLSSDLNLSGKSPF